MSLSSFKATTSSELYPKPLSVSIIFNLSTLRQNIQLKVLQEIHTLFGMHHVAAVQIQMNGLREMLNRLLTPSMSRIFAQMRNITRPSSCYYCKRKQEFRSEGGTPTTTRTRPHRTIVSFSAVQTLSSLCLSSQERTKRLCSLHTYYHFLLQCGRASASWTLP